MRRTHFALLFVFGCLAAFGIWRQTNGANPYHRFSFKNQVPSGGTEPIQPVPLEKGLDERKVRLGEMLFSETRLSSDNSVSCASCHELTKGGSDGLRRSIGSNGGVGQIGAPTVFNSDLNFKQGWDGRSDSLENQVSGQIQSVVEMGTDWPRVVAKLSRISSYNTAFCAIYSDGIQPWNIQDAIATFERSLRTPDCRFDLYLKGNIAAITDEEKLGYQYFKSAGCVSCHQGVNVGGNMFQTFGVMSDYFADRGNLTKADLGRFNVTLNPADRHVFKVPGLRNVAITAPYFHDGSARTMEDAVDAMSRYQLGRTLSPEETRAIVSFLKTLTGKYKGKDL